MLNKKYKILTISAILLLITLLPVFSSPGKEKGKPYNQDRVVLETKVRASEYAALFRGVLHYVNSNYVDEVPRRTLFQGAADGIFYTTKKPESDDKDIINQEFKTFYNDVLKSVTARKNKPEAEKSVFSSIISDLIGEEKQEDTEKDIYTPSEYQIVFLEILNYIDNNTDYEIELKDVFAGSMQGLFDIIGDPHTAYLSQSQILDLSDTTDGEFGGLGIHIQKLVVGENSDSKSKELPYVKIISPIHSTPAYRAGLKAGDYITHIEGESTVDLTSDDVLKRLRGKPGSEVTISILRDRSVNFDIKIKRAIIEIPTEEHAIIDNIGYLKIIQFTHHSAEQIKEVFKDFNKNEVDGIVIDVRNNPGGLLYSVVDIASLIFTDGVVVSTKSRIRSENNTFKASMGHVVPKDMPIAVLINNGSASASEILTGVIKDRNRGTVIGTKTFGKGSVQQVTPFGEGGFKMTVARFYSPNDVTIDKIGIEPDIEVKETSILDLTDDQTLSFIKLLEEQTIGNYLIENKDITENMIVKLTDTIISKGYDIPKDFLINNIRHRVNRGKENPPIYDLEHDEPLVKAIEVLNR